MIPLKEHYSDKVVPQLKNTLALSSHMAVPRIIKVTLNMGVGEVLNDKKMLEQAVEDLTLISGQKPAITKVRKSVANFKIREGMPIGCKVTLRGDRMYDFLQRLLGIAIPRERDFRGLDVSSFDGRGNYTLGLRDQLIFPEIDYSKVNKIIGMNVCIVTNAKTNEEAQTLLGLLGLPFRK